MAVRGGVQLKQYSNPKPNELGQCKKLNNRSNIYSNTKSGNNMKKSRNNMSMDKEADTSLSVYTLRMNRQEPIYRPTWMKMSN